MKKRVGFYGGTFDPPHIAHLGIVLSLLEQRVVDEIFICPTVCSTTKPLENIVASPQDRLEMVRMTFSGIAGVVIWEGEIFQKEPVYTIDTMRSLQGQFPSCAWMLIVGEDIAPQMASWKKGESLIQEFPVIICPRGRQVRCPNTVDIPVFDISSTRIRDRIRKNLFCEHLLSRKVLDFIQQKSLYSGIYG